ncbi:MAG: dual specificity protein phosphatase family protein [Acidobacteriia bacterium]|nr:dual specificity protein phosphatase family protein [Terriglobia bacterium]
MARTFRYLQGLTLLLLSAILVCGGEEAQSAGGSATSQPHSARTIGEKRRVKGIGNFGEVTPSLFRGAQPSQKGFETLAKMGIDIVVDTRGNRAKSEGKEVRALGMKYVAIPWHCPLPHDDVFVKFLKLLQENPNKKVFVHCRLGDDRTGMMVASYRMAAEGWSADEAMIEMKHFGFSTAHHLICPRLAPYEQSFPKRLKSHPAFEGVHSPPQSTPK